MLGSPLKNVFVSATSKMCPIFFFQVVSYETFLKNKFYMGFTTEISVLFKMKLRAFNVCCSVVFY